MKKKINAQKNTSRVVFSLPKEAVEGISTVVVMGDFSEWYPIPLNAKEDGSFAIELEIPNGRDYHFRYQLDDQHWENDWEADRYEASPMYNHIENSVLCLVFEETPKPENATKATNKTKNVEKTVTVIKKRVTTAQITEKSTEDDLTKIEGIGPKIAGLLKADGITTFEKLSKASEKTLKGVLDKGGKRFQIHDPATWAAQAKLAAKGDWKALKKWQDELKGGKVE